VLLDAAGIIAYASPYTEKVLGYRTEEIVGHNIFEFIHPEDASRTAQEYAITIHREGEGAPSVLRIRDTTGEWIPFEIVANNRLHDPAVQAVIFAARDIRFRNEIETAVRRANTDTEKEAEKRVTELARINAELRIENQARRQAESRLQDTISLLNAALESTADGILVVSNDGKVTSSNRKFKEMWRLSAESSLDKTDSRLLGDVTDQLQSPGDFLARVRALYADPSAIGFDVLHFKDGRIFERYSQPQRIDNKTIGRVWSFRDVTHAKNLEVELRQSQKMEALGKLAGGVAHDFNNLLTLISGYVTQLMENPSLEEGLSTCEQILAATRRAASVTKQLLAFSRKQPDAPTVTDLNLIVLNLERVLRRLLSAQIRLQVSVASDPVPVYVDVSQMEMLLINLALNAQDAMPDGGRLSIATSSKPASPKEEGNDANDEPLAVLEVSDTGHGMTPEVQAHIFEPFFTTKQLGRGTGLGLSTVLGIAQRSGGSVEVRSEPNHGAIFRVYLPQVKAAPSATLAAPSIAQRGGGHETILLAEDESGIRAMMRAYLETLGYKVIEAADGAEAIRASFEYAGNINLILTDLLMPNVRGDTAVKTIRVHRPGIKAIFMSGYADRDAVENHEIILEKPFELPELSRALRTVLDSAPASAEGSIHPKPPSS